MIGADTTFLVQLEILEHPAHAAAHATLRREIFDASQPLGLAPQVLAEFVHIVTDPRRFANPLPMEKALHQAAFWWNAAEVQHAFPTLEPRALSWSGCERIGLDVSVCWTHS